MEIVTATIKFPGVSPEGLQKLHGHVLRVENVVPLSVEGTDFSFNQFLYGILVNEIIN